MAVRDGHGKITTDGLVFAIDLGDPRNSYKGKPGTNLLKSPVAWVGDANDINYYDTGQNFYSKTGQEYVDIPTIGTRFVDYVKIKNDFSYCGDNFCRCCPSLFRYGDWGIGVEPSTTYAYTLIYKCDSGYTNPNYLYHYEYGPSGYVTEYGVHSDSNRTHLGDGWYFAWGLITTNANTTVFYPGMWYYNYNTLDKVSVAAVNLVKGSEIRNPRQMFLPSETRTETQALIDLTGNAVLDLSNVSFDSNAKIIFDGTNDYINLGNSTVYNQFEGDFTIAALVKRYPNGGAWGTIIGDYYTSGAASPDEWQIMINNTGNLFLYNTGYVINPISSGFGANTWIYVVVTRIGSIVTMYANGNIIATATSTRKYGGDAGNLNIGIDGNNSAEPFTGEIDVVQIYNRGLNTTEVLQNFNHYKSRYNL